MTTTAAPRVVVPERGTGLRRHAVLTAEQTGRYAWIRWPGPQAPCPFTTLPPELCDRLAGVRTPAGSRATAGEPWHGARRYLLPSPRSIAEELITSRGLRPAEHATKMAELGALVRRLHDRLPPVATAPPPALDRLREWLDGPALFEVHGATRSVVRARLGEDRWSLLASWLEQLSAPTAAPVLAHGWLGLGQCAGDPSRIRVELILGEDVGSGPWQLDVGWLAGQLLELRHFLASPASAPQFDELLAAWFDGYGRRPDEHVHRAAVLDVALHVHDFSAYFRVAEGEPAGWADLLVRLIDEPRW